MPDPSTCPKSLGIDCASCREKHESRCSGRGKLGDRKYNIKANHTYHITYIRKNGKMSKQVSETVDGRQATKLLMDQNITIMNCSDRGEGGR